MSTITFYAPMREEIKLFHFAGTCSGKLHIPSQQNTSTHHTRPSSPHGGYLSHGRQLIEALAGFCRERPSNEDARACQFGLRQTKHRDDVLNGGDK